MSSPPKKDPHFARICELVDFGNQYVANKDTHMHTHTHTLLPKKSRSAIFKLNTSVKSLLGEIRRVGEV